MGGIQRKRMTVPGFLASGIEAGIKEAGKKDLALLFSEVPAVAAGVFTKNVFKAAPVLLDMKRMKKGVAQAVIINSGNANAATGREGYSDALEMARSVARRLGIGEELVLVASTGVIGKRLPLEKVIGHIDRLVVNLRPSGIADAEDRIAAMEKQAVMPASRTFSQPSPRAPARAITGTPWAWAARATPTAVLP